MGGWGALCRRPSRALVYLFGAWAGAWGVYYILQEVRRCFALRLRQRKHPLPARGTRSDAEWLGRASEAERSNIRSRFATLRFCGRYLNVAPEWREQGVWEWMWWKIVHSAIYHGRFGWDGGVSRDLATKDGRARIEALLPVVPLDIHRLWGTEQEPAALGSGVSYTWIGQSTCIVQMHGITVLTDPIFGDQPLASFLSPSRMRPMPCAVDTLRRVDVVLVSHNHFDHLDLSIVPKISEEAHWIVPTGLAGLLVRHGAKEERVTELSWWDEVQRMYRLPVRTDAGVQHVARSVHVAAVPASHWSARTLLDTNRTLWNSYAMRVSLPGAREARFFFCGDSGYSASLFQAIGRMHGPFDVATIPIGSYEPRWHLSLQHMDPHGSVHVAQDVGARTSFAMHWGTWSMSGTRHTASDTDERWDDPPKDLAVALAAEKLPATFFQTVPLGATQTVPL